MATYIVDLAIPAAALERYYAGHADQVRARARDGTVVAFPAVWLRPYVAHAGLHGTFALRTDQAHHLIELARIG